MLRIVSRAWVGALLLSAGVVAAEPQKGAEPKAKPDGREIFERVWTANDPRSHGGDGLGPVFNANSCVVCHTQGGAGGSGGLEHNVELLSVAMPALPTFNPDINPATEKGAPASPEAARKAFDQVLGQAERNNKLTREQLVSQLHADFADGDTIVVHAKGTDEGAHDQWRTGVIGRTRIQQLGGLINQPFNTTVLNTGDILLPNTIQGGFGGRTGRLGFNSVQVFADPNAFPVLTEVMGQINIAKSGSNPIVNGTAAFGSGAVLRTGQRQTTALWGAGLIDRIPTEAIEAIAERQREAGGRVSGRPHRFADGEVGRFGWKGQKASLYDFTMAACANELGLEVPGAKQARVAYRSDYVAKGLDLDASEVDALVDYLASLPAPRRAKTESVELADKITAGGELFASVGCAECHVETVGEVVGLYSDLLLHDMGGDLGSVGSYGVPSIPESDPDDIPVAGVEGSEKPVPPTSREWRTAPLWGVATSAPYLHDGRAKTLEQAIAFHGGEAAEARLRFMMLKPADRARVLAFLEALVAPEIASAE